MSLKPHNFFDLSSFEHKDLFAQDFPAWQALDMLANFFSTIVLGKIETPIPEGAYLVNPHLISIGEGSIIEPGAYIQGPCVLGRNTQIRHGAYIRGNVLAGDGCVIGHCTEIKSAILLDGATAAHMAYIGDSILGRKCNLGAGVKCANLRLDGSSVKIDLVDTKRRKLGAIIGDGVQIGCNTVLSPGTTLGPNTICYPGLAIKGSYPKNSVIKSETHHAHI